MLLHKKNLSKYKMFLNYALIYYGKKVIAPPICWKAELNFTFHTC